MISILLGGNVALFVALLLVLIISLSFHEYGHAYAAKHYGDRTAEMLGRLTINPLKHIDPVGLLMVVMVGFGYAKPVPTNPRNFNSKWATLGVAAAGPFMNLLIAFVVLNVFALGVKLGWTFMLSESMILFVQIVAAVNLALMLFNLIPIGPLDGHYILPYFLPTRLANLYNEYNSRYGFYALLGLLLLSATGVPIFRYVFSFASSLGDYITFI
ncbi:MAG: site-2 protease family protein [Granulosicoccus sp.]|nr:site-2 protease family protein [Granulosicoccus sp.]